MNKKLFTIGEVSKIKGITRKTLRFYERIDLLKPDYVDPVNKYRYYSIEQFIYIDIIKALRALNVSPLSIRPLLKNNNTHEALAFLDSQKEAAAQKINELGEVITRIDEIQNKVRDSLASIAHEDVYLKKIEQRDIITLPYTNIANEEEAILAYSKLDQRIEQQHLFNTYEMGIVFALIEEGFSPSSIYNTVIIGENSDSSNTSTLPAGEYVCICFNTDNITEQNAKLNQYCSDHKIEPTLVLQVELLNDVFSTDSSYFELQLLG